MPDSTGQERDIVGEDTASFDSAAENAFYTERAGASNEDVPPLLQFPEVQHLPTSFFAQTSYEHFFASFLKKMCYPAWLCGIPSLSSKNGGNK
jgi:hypothetical protein